MQGYPDSSDYQDRSYKPSKEIYLDLPIPTGENGEVVIIKIPQMNEYMFNFLQEQLKKYYNVIVTKDNHGVPEEGKPIYRKKHEVIPETYDIKCPLCNNYLHTDDRRYFSCIDPDCFIKEFTEIGLSRLEDQIEWAIENKVKKEGTGE